MNNCKLEKIMLIFNLSLKNHLKILIIYPYKKAKYKVHKMKF